MANVITGNGHTGIALDLYYSAVLAEVAVMRREGVYVCFANIQARMSAYNQEILSNLLWSMARIGALV